MALQPPPRALLFDVFGTCVDWRTTVTNTLYTAAHTALNSAAASLATSLRMRATDMPIEEWAAFAQAWRDSYKEFTQGLAADASRTWKTVDEHHLEALKKLLAEWKLDGLWTDEEVQALSLVWHRLEPWADTALGVQALNTLFYTVTLSNGNTSLLTDLNDHGEIGFTHIFSAELFSSYKPNSKVYLGAVEKLGLEPNQCAMVAAHLSDLRAAKDNGLRTIYVERANEEDLSAEEVETVRKEGWVDVWVSLEEGGGFLTVAAKLGVEIKTSAEMRRSSST
jgi:2-haloacid dehalogenase